MSLAFTVICIVLISKLVGWWRTRKRKTRKIETAYPSVPSASEARDAKRRMREEQNAQRKAGYRASRDAAAQLARREADRALPGAACDAQGGDSMPQGLDRGQAARRGDAAGERRPRAVRQAPRGGHARRPRRAARVARPRRHRTPARPTHKADQCAFDALDAATRASEAADIAAERADSHMCAWPLQRCFRAHMFRRGFYVAYLQRALPCVVGQEAAREKTSGGAAMRGRNAVVLWHDARVPAVPTSAWSSRRSAVVLCCVDGVVARVDLDARRAARRASRSLARDGVVRRTARRDRLVPGARGAPPQARKRAAAALAGELLFAEEKRLQRKKRREAERKQRARENEKRRKNDRKGWLEKRAAANKAADAAADALWATLARSEACAAIVIKGARGPRAEKVNGLYRASRKATRPPLFSSKGAHLFVAKKEGTWAWILGDWSAYEASEARGWATSTTVASGLPPCGKHDFLVADGRGGFQLQWLHCEVVSSRYGCGGRRAPRGRLRLATRGESRLCGRAPRDRLRDAKRQDAPSKNGAGPPGRRRSSLQGREGGGQRHRAGLPDGRQEQRRPRVFTLRAEDGREGSR